MPGYFWIGLRTRIDNPFFLPRFFVIIKSMQALSLVKKSFFEEIAKAGDAVALEKVRVEYVGRNGKLTAVLRSLGGLPLEERKKIGPVAQALRKDMEEAHDKKLSTFNFQHSTSVDLTAPGFGGLLLAHLRFPLGVDVDERAARS